MTREEQGLYREAEKAVTGLLRNFARLRVRYVTVRAMNLSAIVAHIPTDKTVPTDVACWMIDVGKLVLAAERTIHPKAGAVLKLRLIDDISWRNVHHLTGLTEWKAKQVLHASVASILIGMIDKEVSESFAAHAAA